jgi:hypothetical protein
MGKKEIRLSCEEVEERGQLKEGAVMEWFREQGVVKGEPGELAEKVAKGRARRIISELGIKRKEVKGTGLLQRRILKGISLV